MFTNYTGLTDNQLAPVIARLLEKRPGQALIICAGINRARRIASDLGFFSNQRVLVMPEIDASALRYEAKSRAELTDVLAVLSTLSKGENVTVIAPVLGALRKLAPKEAFLKDVFTLKFGGAFDRGDLIARLVRMGYERSTTVEAFGQFAVRGDIVDIFPPGTENPVRVEFFDDEVDSIRSYDAFTQRSIENLSEIDIYPAQLMVRSDEDNRRAIKKISTAYRSIPERRDYLIECIEEDSNTQLLEGYASYFYEKPGSIFDYLKDPSFIMADDPSQIAETLDFYEEEEKRQMVQVLESGLGVKEDFKSHPDPEDIRLVNDTPSALGTFWCTPFTQQIKFCDTLDSIEAIDARQAPQFAGHMDVLERELKRYVKEGYSVEIACSSADRVTNLEDFLQRSGLEGKVLVINGSLISGTELPHQKLLYLSESDIFAQAKKMRKMHKKGQEIKVFTDIRKGDYVVHEDYGVGRFAGVEKLTIGGIEGDFLRIEYAGTDVLNVPVSRMEGLQKYVGSDAAPPKIHRLSGTEWQATKARARAAIKEMADDLLKLSAERQMAKGYAFGPDSAWQKEFEDAFEYQETDDQLRCAEEIKADMEKPIVMDRLLCGDVGYGKTEVAARAIFKCLEAGKQAAVLVPTTILANQHFNTFTSRFADYPFKVDMLSRFRTDRQQQQTVAGLKKGEVDLVVGTHRLLSKDVEFKDLGLLVIDEEQRFGVEHKETIKRLKASVDVLTLSATPIPRTLHMSLTGLRDMSVIEEPPEDRYPVQTYVMEQDDALLSGAIKRELARGGQVYVVYNRVRGINRVAEEIRKLVPEATVSVGHGQMSERMLEDTMIEFAEGRSQVLVATTIIESGLDIPNVNTLIVLDADRFGLSQLYQLRGRVGRSNRMAYAYLFFKKDKVLSEIAQKRLKAIREFTEFGSGFRIAMRDLELRGAGNILGAEQSGHMVSVGYELYCKLVEEVVAELQGVTDEEKPIEADTQVDFGVPALIPDRYISDDDARLSMYKRIAAIDSEDDRLEVEGELLDRFGDLPQETINLLDIALVRSKASKLGIKRLVKQQNQLIARFEERNALSPEKWAELSERFGLRLTIYGGNEPRISLVTANNQSALSAAKELIKALA